MHQKLELIETKQLLLTTDVNTLRTIMGEARKDVIRNKDIKNKDGLIVVKCVRKKKGME